MPIGLDNALDGAAVYLSSAGQIKDQIVMPNMRDRGKNVVDTRTLVEWLKPLVEETVYLEDFQENLGGPSKFNRVANTPMMTRSLSESFASIWTCLTLLGMRRKAIMPREWQRQFWAYEKGLDTKEEALKAALLLQPDHDFRKSERATKPHDGIVDAYLIAEFARRESLDGLLPPTVNEEFEIEFVRAWNALTAGTGVSKIRSAIPDGRLSQWQQRLKQPSFREGWEEALKYAVTDPFYLGDNGRNWKLNLKYFLQPNSVSILLGKAQDKKLAAKKAQQKEDEGNW